MIVRVLFKLLLMMSFTIRLSKSRLIIIFQESPLLRLFLADFYYFQDQLVDIFIKSHFEGHFHDQVFIPNMFSHPHLVFDGGY